MTQSQIRAGMVLTYAPVDEWLKLRRGEECVVLYVISPKRVVVEFADTTKWSLRTADLQPAKVAA